MPTRALLFTLLLTASLAARADDLMVLLEQRKCRQCRLADADLVHADLRDADLQRAQLQRANLGRALLDGADLRGSNLQFTNLKGASLRRADLRGSKLYGTDLRQADLSGARLDEGALKQAHWQGAQGISTGIRSHAALHNAGVTAAEHGDWKQAEALFGAAIAVDHEEPLSWVARGLCRGELAVCGTPAVVVPFPHAADKHQEANAAYAASLGAAVIVHQHDPDQAGLLNTVQRLLAVRLDQSDSAASLQP